MFLFQGLAFDFTALAAVCLNFFVRVRPKQECLAVTAREGSTQQKRAHVRPPPRKPFPEGKFDILVPCHQNHTFLTDVPIHAYRL